MTAAFRLRDLALQRGGRTVLSKVNAEIPRGAVTVLVGRNGAGKTTLMAALCRLVPPAAGTIELDGQDVAGLGRAAFARAVASLGQDERPEDELSALEVVLLGRAPHLGAWGLPSEADVTLARRALAEADAADLERRRLGTLSGGERQRVLLARVLCQDAPTLLLDEPTHALDLRHAALAMDVLRARARAGAAVVVVIHDLTLAARCADHWLVLGGGSLLHAGPLAADALAGVLTRALEAPVQVVPTQAGMLVGPA